MARVAIGHVCWEGLGHILAGWKWNVQIWGGGCGAQYRDLHWTLWGVEQSEDGWGGQGMEYGV